MTEADEIFDGLAAMVREHAGDDVVVYHRLMCHVLIVACVNTFARYGDWQTGVDVFAADVRELISEHLGASEARH